MRRENTIESLNYRLVRDNNLSEIQKNHISALKQDMIQMFIPLFLNYIKTCGTDALIQDLMKKKIWRFEMKFKEYVESTGRKELY